MGAIQRTDEGGDEITRPWRAPPYVDNCVITVAGTAETMAVPTGADYVEIMATSLGFVRWDGNPAAVPAADTADGTGSEIVIAGIPMRRRVTGLANFSLNANPAATFSCAFWKSKTKIS